MGLQKIHKPIKYRAVDTSGNNNHGRLYSGRALEFDGVSDRFATTGGGTHSDSYGGAGEADGYEGVNKFADGESWTMAVWMYLNGRQDCYVIGKDQSTRPHLYLNTASNIQYLEIRCDDSGNDFYRFGLFQEDTWNRLVVTSNGTSLSAYANGQLIGTISDGQASTDSSGSFTSTEMWFTGWGSSYESGGNYGTSFDGMMSDAQVWDVEWSSSDIEFDFLNPESLALNNSGTSLTESNLKLWYPMQDGHRGQQSFLLDGANTGLSDELITNTDYESGVSSWSEKQCTISHETSSPISGGGSLKASSLANASAGPFQNIGMEAGVTYKVSGKMKLLTGSSTGTVKIISSSSTGSSQDIIYSGTSGGLSTAAKTATSFTAYVVGMANQPSIQFACNVADGSFLLDDVSVKAVNGKHPASTVFEGDEMISTQANRQFNSSGQWVGFGSPTSAAISGAKLQVETTGDSSSEGATLPVANLTAPVVGRTYRIKAKLDDVGTANADAVYKFGFGGGSTTITATNTSYSSPGPTGGVINTTEQEYFADVVAINTTGDLIIEIPTSGNDAATTFTIDDVSVKELGVATGWTDADQKDWVPQTALQSHNELAWFPGTDPGTDYEVEAPKNAAIDDIWSGGGTFSGWVCPVSDGAASNARIIDKNKWHIYLAEDDGTNCKIKYSFEHATTDATGNTGLVLPLQKWSHVAVTYNSDNVGAGNEPVIYVNGESVDVTETDSVGAYVTDDGDDLFFGNKENGSRTFAGTLTEFSLWNKALSVSEVRELYNDGIALDATTHSYAAISTNLKGYWRNNGLATWTDLSEDYSNHAVPLNLTETILIPAGVDASRDTQGFIMNKKRQTNSLNLPYNTAVDGYVDLLEETTIAAGSAFSITLWVKPSHLGDNRFIGSGTDYIRFKTSSQIRISANGSVFNISLSSGSWNVNEWIHMGIVRDTSNDVTMYVNGESQNTVAVAQPFDYRYIGAFDSSDTFDGAVDDVCIYNDELSAAEVKRNYNAGKRSHR